MGCDPYGDLAADEGGGELIGQAETNAGEPIDPKEPCGVGHVDEAERAVVLVHPHLEDPGERELFQPGQDPRGGGDGLRRDERDLVSYVGPERTRELDAQDHAEPTGAETGQMPGHHALSDHRYLPLHLG